jgi:16S rRNA (cytidine1402-2'-O)-methyltransferase
MVSPAPPSLLRAAADAAGGQSYPVGALYVVATPIGNRADLTLRALHVLSLVDAIACEDTRHTGQLLQALGLHKPLLAVHEHNERQAAQAVIERLQRGERVACVSDAGTPAVSDPGATLVAAVSAAGLRCIPIPGSSAALAALSVAGDASAAVAGAGFTFVGFLPPKGAERRAALQRVAAEAGTQVLYEAPHRIEALAAELAEHAPERTLTVCRELTKQFESVHTAPAADWPTRLAAQPDERRGEFVLVLHAKPQVPATAADDALPPEAERVLDVLLAELPLKQAVALAVSLTGLPRNALYSRALALREADPARQ